MDIIYNIDFEAILQSSLIIVGKIIFLLIAFGIISPLGKKLLKKIIHRIGNRQKLSEGRKKTLEKLLVNIYTYIVMFIFFITFLDIIGIPVGPILTGAGIVGLAVSFGAQGLVSD